VHTLKKYSMWMIPSKNGAFLHKRFNGQSPC
jgi:hypothetical protein